MSIVAKSFVFVALTAPFLFAQEGVAPRLYKLNVAFHELEGGKRVKTKNYMMQVKPGEKNSMRFSSRVAYYTSPEHYQFLDVGIGLDFLLRGDESQVSVDGAIDISWPAVEENATAEKKPPGMNQFKSQMRTTLVPGKPAVVASYDDLASVRRYEIELTASPVK
jgi:hypothetical protein